MKNVVVCLLSLLLTLSLCACSNTDTTYHVEARGKNFQINTEKKTIFDGTYTYEYTFSGDSSIYEINIIYPNGSKYYWTQSEMFGHGGWSDDYNEELYVNGTILCDVVVTKAPKPSNPTKVITIILLIVLGAFDAAFPHLSWNLGYGWRYKNAEPSDIALKLIRVSGIVIIVIGVCMIFS